MMILDSFSSNVRQTVLGKENHLNHRSHHHQSEAESEVVSDQCAASSTSRESTTTSSTSSSREHSPNPSSNPAEVLFKMMMSSAAKENFAPEVASQQQQQQQQQSQQQQEQNDDAKQCSPADEEEADDAHSDASPAQTPVNAADSVNGEDDDDSDRASNVSDDHHRHRNHHKKSKVTKAHPASDEKEKEISKLFDTMKRLESTIDTLRESTNAQILQLNLELNQKNQVIETLKERLHHDDKSDNADSEDGEQENEDDDTAPTVESPPPPATIAPEVALESLSHTFNPALRGGPLDSLESRNVFEQLHLLERAKALQQQSISAGYPAGLLDQLLPHLQGLGNVNAIGGLFGGDFAALRQQQQQQQSSKSAHPSTSGNNESLSPRSNNDDDAPSSGRDRNSPRVMSQISATSSAHSKPMNGSAIMLGDGAEPLHHSPLGATTAADLGLHHTLPHPHHLHHPQSHRHLAGAGAGYSPVSTPIGSSPSPNVAYEKLQHQLRANVEKYMNENLNTLHISRCVRELLSMHNIGQRLFAKYVLGLSQGTVSELLSKPKPWDKLTEKGRDSYRKMHGWATDQGCINLLKSMVPRKDYGSHAGKESNYTSTPKPEDSMAEERIAAILSEAQRSMKSNVGPQIGARATPTDPNVFFAQQMNSMMLNGDNNKFPDLKLKLDTDSVDNERTVEHKHHNDSGRKSEGLDANTLASLYNKSKENEEDANRMQAEMMRMAVQEQIAKLLSAHMAESLRNSAGAAPEELNALCQMYGPALAMGFMPGTFPGQMPMGLDALQGSQNANNHLENLRKAQLEIQQGRDLSTPSSIIDPLRASASPSTLNGASSHPLLGNGDLSGNGAGSDDLASNPLARMQSITNSLLTQSAIPSLPSQTNRPAKAVLPPITQQQFDMYNNLNTEDIVKRVKEQLSQYSISQRLFGESVLGLSQGSVSDLLARPKPWHMLTQKGREPFIRMKMFLEDDNAIHKLVASQYKIAPEKLMRTGNFVSAAPGASALAAVGMPMNSAAAAAAAAALAASKGAPSLKALEKHFETQAHLAAVAAFNLSSPRSPNMTMSDTNRSNTSSPDTAISHNSNAAPSPHSAMRAMACNRMPSFGGNLANLALNNTIRPPSNQSAGLQPQPSVYELAALTSDLDTQLITTRIKETLMANNIGQKIFGEVVLGLSQGSVSELLSKPKPWHMLSIKGREPFIRMQLWLNDKDNIEKLQTLKNERREANKRRRGGGAADDSFGKLLGDNPGMFPFGNIASLINSGANPKGLVGFGSGFPMAAASAGSQQPAQKKARILFTEEQKEALRIAFAMDPYPSSSTAEFLAKELNLSNRTITNWFHNHRMRLKQINTSAPNEDTNSSLPYIQSREGSNSFDQNNFRQALSQRLSELKLRQSNLTGNGTASSNNGSGRTNSPNSSRFKYANLFPGNSSASITALAAALSNSSSSPGSSSPFQDDDDVGMDLSMSSQNNNKNGDDDSSDNDNEDKKNKTSNTGSSNRRKPSQPQQWGVDPLCFAQVAYGGEDDYEEDDDDDDDDDRVDDGCDSDSVRSTKRAHDDDVGSDVEVETAYKRLKPSGAANNNNPVMSNKDDLVV